MKTVHTYSCCFFSYSNISQFFYSECTIRKDGRFYLKQLVRQMDRHFLLGEFTPSVFIDSINRLEQWRKVRFVKLNQKLFLQSTICLYQRNISIQSITYVCGMYWSDWNPSHITLVNINRWLWCFAQIN